MSLVERDHLPAQEFLQLPESERSELVRGRLVEKDESLLSSFVAGRITSLLDQHVLPLGLGWVLPEIGIRCFPNDPEQIRRPDISFIRAERLPTDRAFELRVVDIPPDLTVEVLSPNDLVYEVSDKVTEYLEAGILRVWVVNPSDRSVTIHRLDGAGVILRHQDELVEDVIPGFRARVGDFFKPPERRISQ